jgi:hypothetical protein
MFRKEIKPLSESMIDAIGNTINKLEYVEEKVNVKGIQKAIDDGKSMDEIMTMFANKRTTNTDEIRKVAKEYMWKKRMKKEEVELEEKMDPVGKEDADIDNDGDVDSSDKYLHARRKAISKAMKKRKMNEQDTKMGTITVNSDEERKKRAAAYRAKKMKNEEVELEEGAKFKMGDIVADKKGNVYSQDFVVTKVIPNINKSKPASYKLATKDGAESPNIWPESRLKLVKSVKEELELDEGYTIYHKTFSSAVQHAISQVEKQGYTVDEEEWDRKVAMGPKKPSAGKTNSYTIPLLKNGNPTPRKLQMQVYYDEGRYELNMYIS